MSLASIGATVYQAVAGVLGPVFSAPLDNTAWAGSNAPATFVRDTVATIPDHEGLIKEVVANEIRFEGARRVENLCLKSEDFTDTEDSSTGWLLISASGDSRTHTPNAETDPNGVPLNADTIEFVTDASPNSYATTIIVDAADHTVPRDIVLSVWLKGLNGTTDWCLNMYDGAHHRTSLTITSEWQRYSILVTTDGGDNIAAYACDARNGNMDSGTFKAAMWGAQAEDVTGQSNQNPSEYVSVGVGTGPNRVTNGGFDTDTDWSKGPQWTIANGSATLDGTAGSYRTLQQTITAETQTVQATVVVSENTLAGGLPRVYFGVGSSSADTGDRSAINSGETGTFTATFDVDSSDVKAFIRNETNTSGSFVVDSFNVVKCDHGANVDAVKYFDTENGNTVSSNVVTEATGSAIAAATLDNPRIERAATNLLDESVAFDTEPWDDGGANCTVVLGALLAPDGTTSMASFTETATTATHRAEYDNVTGATLNVTHSMSFYAKKGTGNDWCRVQMTDNAGAHQARAWFNLDTGAVGSSDTVGDGVVTDHYMESVGNDVYRCVLIGRPESGGATITIYMGMANADLAVTYLGDVGATTYFWGAQLEAATYPTTYIATSGAAATRDKDEFEYSLTPAVNDITIACDWTPREDSAAAEFLLSSTSDGNNYISLLYDGTKINLRKVIGGANNDAEKVLDFTAGITYRVVGRLSSTAGVDIWLDGVKGTNDNTTTDAVVGTNIVIGQAGYSSGFLRTMNVGNVVYYNRALTDAECAAL